jgi:hypothetical protein
MVFSRKYLSSKSVTRVSQRDYKQGHGSGGEKKIMERHDLHGSQDISINTNNTTLDAARYTYMTMTNGGKITETGYRRSSNNAVHSAVDIIIYV